MKKKLKLYGIIALILAIGVLYLYFKYFFSYEQRNIIKRRIETFTGQNMTVTIFGYDGKIIKRWNNVKKITSAKDGRAYTFFYTKDDKYVQIPNSIWYVAEEED